MPKNSQNSSQKPNFFSFGPIWDARVDFLVLGVPRKLWMSSFQKAKEIKNPTVGSKVMTSGSMMMFFSQFSQYLNYFNSDFGP